jgi:hypothetical protein
MQSKSYLHTKAVATVELATANKELLLVVVLGIWESYRLAGTSIL